MRIMLFSYYKHIKIQILLHWKHIIPPPKKTQQETLFMEIIAACRMVSAVDPLWP
jgi:hypothetical protein